MTPVPLLTRCTRCSTQRIRTPVTSIWRKLPSFPRPICEGMTTCKRALFLPYGKQGRRSITASGRPRASNCYWMPSGSPSSGQGQPRTLLRLRPIYANDPHTRRTGYPAQRGAVASSYAAWSGNCLAFPIGFLKAEDFNPSRSRSPAATCARDAQQFRALTQLCGD